MVWNSENGGRTWEERVDGDENTESTGPHVTI